MDPLLHKTAPPPFLEKRDSGGCFGLLWIVFDLGRGGGEGLLSSLLCSMGGVSWCLLCCLSCGLFVCLEAWACCSLISADDCLMISYSFVV